MTNDYKIVDRLRDAESNFRYEFKQGRSGGPEDANMCQEAANRIEELERVLTIIASEGEGRFQWSMTQAEALARKVIANG